MQTVSHHYFRSLILILVSSKVEFEGRVSVSEELIKSSGVGRIVVLAFFFTIPVHYGKYNGI